MTRRHDGDEDIKLENHHKQLSRLRDQIQDQQRMMDELTEGSGERGGGGAQEEKFQTAPFEEIAAHCGARTLLLQSEVFDLIIHPVTCSRAPRRSTDSRSFYPIGATL
nr:protein EFR3 homolog B-like isoform X2 [Labrus bergylta]